MNVNDKPLNELNENELEELASELYANLRYEEFLKSRNGGFASTENGPPPIVQAMQPKPKPKPVASLSTRAMLVTTVVRTWSARRHDKRVSREVAAQHGTDENSGRYNKQLVAKQAIDKVAKIAGKIRSEHYSQTLPWGDDKARILPAAQFDNYAATMRRLFAEFDAAADELARNYPDLVAQARIDLNGLFDADDYPDPAFIRDKFSVRYSVRQLPDAADFRVQLDASEVARIRQQIEQDTSDGLRDAIGNLWERLLGVVNSMAETLSKPDKIFRNSLVENVAELCEVLPALNLTDNPQLENFRRKVAEQFADLDPEVLRRDKPRRLEVAEQAASVASDIENDMAAFMGR